MAEQDRYEQRRYGQGSSEQSKYEESKYEQGSLFFFEEKPKKAPVYRDPWETVENLEELREMALKCTRCDLRRGCKGVVFGEGDPGTRLMLVGEGPGAVEDELGRPFVGPAGQLLDKILESVGFARVEVYIANSVKCRPPDNRIPEPGEIDACLPWLAAQMRIIKPSILVCLGASAAKTLIDPKARITQIRGQWFDRDGIKVMPTYHPAALLRDVSKKLPVWEDFKKVRAEYDKIAR